MLKNRDTNAQERRHRILLASGVTAVLQIVQIRLGAHPLHAAVRLNLVPLLKSKEMTGLHRELILPKIKTLVDSIIQARRAARKPTIIRIARFRDAGIIES